jgi:hypothetical protein
VDEFNDLEPFFAALSVEIVVLRRVSGSRLVVPQAGSVRLDLEQQEPLSEEAVEELRGSHLVLAAEGDVPRDVVEELLDRAVPAAFEGSVWLGRARALALDDGETEIAGFKVGYRPGLGLWIGDTGADQPE